MVSRALILVYKEQPCPDTRTYLDLSSMRAARHMVFFVTLVLMRIQLQASL